MAYCTYEKHEFESYYPSMDKGDFVADALCPAGSQLGDAARDRELSPEQIVTLAARAAGRSVLNTPDVEVPSFDVRTSEAN